MEHQVQNLSQLSDLGGHITHATVRNESSGIGGQCHCNTEIQQILLEHLPVKQCWMFLITRRRPFRPKKGRLKTCRYLVSLLCYECFRLSCCVGSRGRDWSFQVLRSRSLEDTNTKRVNPSLRTCHSIQQLVCIVSSNDEPDVSARQNSTEP